MPGSKTDPRLYPLKEYLEISSRLLGVSASAIIEETELDHENSRVTANKYFEVWSALEKQYNRPDFAFRIGTGFARGGFLPSLIAFSSSPNIIRGMGRLADFKSLMGPITIKTEAEEKDFSLLMICDVENLPIPPSLAACEWILFLELFRLQTGRKIIPLEVVLPTPYAQNFFEVPCKRGPRPRLVLSMDDALAPLLGKDPAIFSAVEPELNRRLGTTARSGPAAEQCRIALLETIPTGKYSLAEIAAKLHLSKRSLQRFLGQEGTSFQKVLDQTKAELGQRYLKSSQLSLQEIAFALDYASVPSFSRAFKRAFGVTPRNYRRDLGD